jgi:PAS domain S-box-containing protein
MRSSILRLFSRAALLAIVALCSLQSAVLLFSDMGWWRWVGLVAWGLVALATWAAHGSMASWAKELLTIMRRMNISETSEGGGITARGKGLEEVRAAILEIETVWSRLQMRLREAEAKYRTLLGQFPIVPYVASLDETFGKVVISPQMGPVLGFSPSQWLQSPDLWIRHIHPDDRKKVLDQIREACARGEPLTCEYRMLDRYGRVMWFRDEARVVRDPQGRPQFLQGLLLDTSEQKRSEEALKESEERFRKIVDTAHEGIWVVDASGRTSYANHRLAQMLGMSLQEVLNLSFHQVVGQGTASHGVQETLLGETGQHNTREVALRRKDGTVLWALLASSPLENGAGQRVSTLHMVTEISERKKMEEQLREYGERLRLLASHLEGVREEERTWIAREIHDELGQGLTGLKLDLAELDRRLTRVEWPEQDKNALKGRIQEMLHCVDGTIQRVREICTQLRPPILDNLGLAAAIEWQLSEFERKTGVSTRFHTWEVEPELDMDRTTTLFRVFQELLTNAARHSGASLVEVRLEALHKEVMLELRDNGCGIQGQAISGRSGLGLLGIRERVGLLGGSLELGSAPGWGTRALVRIPLARQEG